MLWRPGVCRLLRGSIVDGFRRWRVVYRLSVPRWRCRRLGPSWNGSSTFSVLPACVIPRRRFDLSLICEISHRRGRESTSHVLDWLSRSGLVVEERSLRRLSQLVVVVLNRLRSQPLTGISPPEVMSLSGLYQWLEASGLARAPPHSWVLWWNDKWDRLLWSVSLH